MNQMTIFDFLKNEVEEQPIIFRNGETVYTVDLGEVRKATVQSNYNFNKVRGYRTEHGIILNRENGTRVFKSKQEANKKAIDNLRKIDHIKKEDIRLSDVIAYMYIRKVDNYKMWAFIGRYKNMAYVKDYYQFHHIEKNYEESLIGFVKGKNENDRVKEIPEVKNMYKCINSDWIYSEEGYPNIDNRKIGEDK